MSNCVKSERSVKVCEGLSEVAFQGKNGNSSVASSSLTEVCDVCEEHQTRVRTHKGECCLDFENPTHG